MNGLAETFARMSSNAKDNSSAWDEYRDETDGLMHCSRCRQPREIRFVLFGREMQEHCTCKCQEEEIRRQQQERDEQKRLERLAQLRKQGFEESAMQELTFEADDGKSPKIKQAAMRYCERFAEFREQGLGLCIYGNVGRGKTFTAACIANELIDKGYAVMMTNFQRIINRMQESFEGRQRYLDELNGFDLLIIDDLAAERDTEFVNEIVYTVIDSRYRLKRPLIVTTNITPSEMQAVKEISRRRIYSRVLEICHPLEIIGTDRRKQAAVNKMSELSKLLGV